MKNELPKLFSIQNYGYGNTNRLMTIDFRATLGSSDGASFFLLELRTISSLIVLKENKHTAILLQNGRKDMIQLVRDMEVT